MTAAPPRFQALKILGLGLGGAVLFGIAQDNVTARIAPAYFNVAHPDLGYPAIFHHSSPTVLALVWGVAATWWIGLPLGLLLAVCARAGGWPKLGAADLLRPVGVLLAAMAAAAIAGGVLGSVLGLSFHAPHDVPLEQRAGWGVDWGAHLAAYAVGPPGGLIVCVGTLWRRRRLARGGG